MMGSMSSRCSSRGSFASSMGSSFRSSNGGGDDSVRGLSRSDFGSQKSMGGTSFRGGLEGSPAQLRRQRLLSASSKRRNDLKMKRQHGKMGLQDLTVSAGGGGEALTINNAKGATDAEKRRSFLKNTNTDRQRRLFDKHRKKGTSFFLDSASSIHVHWRRETVAEKLERPYDYDNSAAVTYKPFLVAKSKSTEQFFAKAHKELQRVIALKQSDESRSAQRDALLAHFSSSERQKRKSNYIPSQAQKDHTTTPNLPNFPSVSVSGMSGGTGWSLDQSLKSGMSSSTHDASDLLIIPRAPSHASPQSRSQHHGGVSSSSPRHNHHLASGGGGAHPPHVVSEAAPTFQQAMESALTTTKKALENKLSENRDRAISQYNRNWIERVQRRIVGVICKDLIDDQTEAFPTKGQHHHNNNQHADSQNASSSDGTELGRASPSTIRRSAQLPPATDVLSTTELKVFDTFKKHFKVADDITTMSYNATPLTDKERVRKISRHNRTALRHVILNKFTPDELQEANVQFIIMRMIPLFPLATEKDVVNAFRDSGVPLHLVDRSFLALDALCPRLTQQPRRYTHDDHDDVSGVEGGGMTSSRRNTSDVDGARSTHCLLYTSPSPRDS
eukprot:TRINITY_DN14257_c0_g1_i2.p1 TRINITY_DN14257_c0_g1~~TRINITY_DN14257_c0_g1_i2.p1  ORF type:complete len:615 (+),score=66.00 TRINITY_DN14257_c0_g1_i2:275-2119(+)